MAWPAAAAAAAGQSCSYSARHPCRHRTPRCQHTRMRPSGSSALLAPPRAPPPLAPIAPSHSSTARPRPRTPGHLPLSAAPCWPSDTLSWSRRSRRWRSRSASQSGGHDEVMIWGLPRNCAQHRHCHCHCPARRSMHAQAPLFLTHAHVSVSAQRGQGDEATPASRHRALPHPPPPPALPIPPPPLFPSPAGQVAEATAPVQQERRRLQAGHDELQVGCGTARACA